MIDPAKASLPTLDIPRYHRLPEADQTDASGEPIPANELDDRIGASQLSAGSRDLLRALLRVGSPRMFPGGLGLEYGALFKTATRPDLLGRHTTEVAAHLRDNRVDLLVVPGMSGYPIGAMYSQASAVPAILLKKQTSIEALAASPPPGSFLIPSYTGQADTLISADMPAVIDLLRDIVARQIAAQITDPELVIDIRIAGADEIIDKATMATAITETAPVFCESGVRAILAAHPVQTGDRPVHIHAEVVAWVTPMIKAYNRSGDLLRDRFGIDTFAGLSLTSLQLDPPAVGVDGLGLVAFNQDTLPQ